MMVFFLYSVAEMLFEIGSCFKLYAAVQSRFGLNCVEWIEYEFRCDTVTHQEKHRFRFIVYPCSLLTHWKSSSRYILPTFSSFLLFSVNKCLFHIYIYLRFYVNKRANIAMSRCMLRPRNASSQTIGKPINRWQIDFQVRSCVAFCWVNFFSLIKLSLWH